MIDFSTHENKRPTNGANRTSSQVLRELYRRGYLIEKNSSKTVSENQTKSATSVAQKRD